MPNFYFDVREGEILLRDEEGLHLADIAAAEHEAADIVAMLARELLPRSRFRPIVVEVRDSEGQRLVVVTCAFISWRIDRS
jgi:hypothetical protein